MIVLDTNVLSEVLRPSPAEAVLRWLAAQEPLVVWTTTVTQAEMLYGIEVLPAGKRRTSLADIVEKIFAEDKVMADRKALARPISPADAIITAIARSRDPVIATRNTTRLRALRHPNRQCVD